MTSSSGTSFSLVLLWYFLRTTSGVPFIKEILAMLSQGRTYDCRGKCLRCVLLSCPGRDITIRCYPENRDTSSRPVVCKRTNLTEFVFRRKKKIVIDESCRTHKNFYSASSRAFGDLHISFSNTCICASSSVLFSTSPTVRCDIAPRFSSRNFNEIHQDRNSLSDAKIAPRSFDEKHPYLLEFWSF